jgi:hypothetical protein
MTHVILGSNHFEGCDNIVAIRQHALLRVETSPLRLSLTTPPELPSARRIQVVDNEVRTGSDIKVRVVKSETSVAIFWDETPLLIATALDDVRVSLRLDLRPIGINLYDDALGLHAGSNNFAGNQIVNCQTAIALG